MAKLIEVEERDIDYLFSRSKPYKLDIYQRDYRWNDKGNYKMVLQLLKDIELRFEYNFNFNRASQDFDLKETYLNVENNFKPYFLNTIMLNEQGGDIYIVDGQQRLTTILLILIALYHIAKDSKKEDRLFPIDRFLGEKIFQEDKIGEKHFRISNQDRNFIIEKIFNRTKIESVDIKNITQKNLKDNYEIIFKYFSRYFYNKSKFDYIKFNHYFYYLSSKVLIIEQTIKESQDIAMIFETANDRGKELEPHEVLKGMLLGSMKSIKDKENCNRIWNEALNSFFEKDGDYKDFDNFLRTYLRAKYADNKSQYQLFSGKYHRELLSNSKIIRDLDRDNPDKIKEFIENRFIYFYKLYLEIQKIATEERDIFLASNMANEQNQQFLLILSAIEFNDANREKKISTVAKHLDRLYTLTRLMGVYDSNKHQDMIYELNREIREQDVDEIETIFNNRLLTYLQSKNLSITTIDDIFSYKYFKEAKHRGRFTKYILARVDIYLAELLSEQSFAKQHTLHFITHSGNKPKNGFHIEHIFAFNEEIMNQFKDSSGNFDEVLFNRERDRLGALLLLKGNENIRTSNWIYKKKFDSYSNSGFIWNRILTGAVNKSSLKIGDDIVNRFKSYKPDKNGLLDIDSIEERQQLLFELIKRIWR